MAQTQNKETTKTTAPAAKNEVAVFVPPRLPWHDRIGETYGDLGVEKSTWKALVESVFPAAQSVDSVMMVLAYCKARKLDPFKRVVHIVPIYDRNKKQLVDTVWPGIAEHRTTASRTGGFAGFDKAEFGPMITRTFEGSVGRGDNEERRNITVTFPEWCQITVYRIVKGVRCPFNGPKVYWLEYYNRIGRTDLPNDRWQRSPIQMLEKCAEAGALRRAFPEELGDEMTVEEAGAAIARDIAENAIDVTPKPTRKLVDAEVVTPAKVFEVEIVGLDGEPERYTNPEQAAETMLVLARDAAKRGGWKAVEVFWKENNNHVLPAIAEFRKDIADQTEDALATGIKTMKEKDETAKPATEAKETAKPKKAAAEKPKKETKPTPPAAEIVPASPLNDKKAEWPPFTAWLVKTLQRLPKVEREGFLKQHGKAWAFITVNRSTDYDNVMAALDTPDEERPRD